MTDRNDNATTYLHPTGVRITSGELRDEPPPRQLDELVGLIVEVTRRVPGDNKFETVTVMVDRVNAVTWDQTVSPTLRVPNGLLVRALPADVTTLDEVYFVSLSDIATITVL